jgi:putative holliday junction resolvase
MTTKEAERYKDKTIVGLDHGDARTGLAIGINGSVTPMRTIESKDMHTTASLVAKQCKQNKAALIVLGLPLDYDQQETQQSLKVRQFAKLLKVYVGTPVIFCNELGTTVEASESPELELVRSLKKREDSVSAAIILKRFCSETLGF